MLAAKRKLAESEVINGADGSKVHEDAFEVPSLNFSEPSNSDLEDEALISLYETDTSETDEEAISIIPRARKVISNITGHTLRQYPEIEPDYDSDSSTEDVRDRYCRTIAVLISYFQGPEQNRRRATSLVRRFASHWVYSRWKANFTARQRRRTRQILGYN